MLFPEKAVQKITAIIPDYLIQQRDGGSGKQLSYISGSTVIDILNSAFDYLWDWTVDEQFIQESQKKFNKWSKVPDSEKVMYNGQKGAWEDQSPVAHVRGTLTVYIPQTHSNGEVTYLAIKKTGFGSKVILGGASEQESVFKAAGTDALKKAASLLGIGAQLYRNEEETYFFYNELNYEDPWTDEELTKHQADRDYITNLMETYPLDEEQMISVIQQCGYDDCDSLNYIVPSNIEDIVKKIKQLVAEAKKEQNKE